MANRKSDAERAEQIRREIGKLIPLARTTLQEAKKHKKPRKRKK